MGCGLRKEIEDMLSLAGNSEQYSLECCKYRPHDFLYVVFRRRGHCGWRDIVVSGRGSSKAGAMRALLESWRGGKTEMPRVAGSREELRMKLAILGREK